MSKNCSSCNTTFALPTIHEGTAYFVCDSCGHCEEVSNYKEYSIEECVTLFEGEYSVKLPKAFVDYTSRESITVPIPAHEAESLRYFFGDEETFTIDPLFTKLKGEARSIFDSSYLCSEWELPMGLVLISGDGHFWTALDYRSSLEPQVILLSSDDHEYAVIAESFHNLLDIALT